MSRCLPRVLWLGCVVLLAAQAAAFEPGQLVVASKNLRLIQRGRPDPKQPQEKPPQRELGIIPRGTVVEVQQVRGNLLRIEKPIATWVPGDSFVPRQDAAGIYTELIEKQPENLNLYLLRAGALIEAGNWDAALADLSHLLRYAPDQPELYAMRAQLFVQKQEVDQALADLNMFLRSVPDAPVMYQFRGELWYRKGEYAKAVDDFNRAIVTSRRVVLGPEFVPLLTTRGRAFYRLGEYEKAVADFRRALELDDRYAEAHRGLAWLLACCPDKLFRDGPQAVLSATEACERVGWKNAACLETLAAAYATAGLMDDAVKTQLQAIALAERSGEADFDLAAAQARLAQYRQGKPYRDPPAPAAKQPAAEPPR